MERTGRVFLILASFCIATALTLMHFQVADIRHSHSTGEDFDDQDVEQHINKKEALVFYRSLYNFLPPHEELVKNKR